MTKENISENEIDIAKEFNIILDSIADESNFTHDRYLRFAFANPKRMAELLELYARRKPSLREFLDTIDLSTLRGAPENFSNDKHTGSADLVFEADLKTGGEAGLYVGILAEHKSDVDYGVMKQMKMSLWWHSSFIMVKTSGTLLPNRILPIIPVSIMTSVTPSRWNF